MNSRWTFLLLIFIFTASPLLVFAGERELPTMRLTLEGKSLEVEIVRSEADRQKGLMNRKSMPQNHGMLFISDQEQVASFWMKNTLIPLDVAFIDTEGKIVRIATMTVVKKGDQPITYSSVLPVKYALETNAGWFEKNGIQVGDSVKELAVK